MNTDKPEISNQLALLKESAEPDKREFAALIHEAASSLLADSPPTTSEALIIQSEACMRVGEIFRLDAKALFDKAREISTAEPDVTPRKVARSLLSDLASSGSSSSLVRSLAAEMLEEGYGKY